MNKKRYTEEQIIDAIKQYESGIKVDDLCLVLPQVCAQIKQLDTLQILPVTDSLDKSVFVAGYKISQCNQAKLNEPEQGVVTINALAQLSVNEKSFLPPHYHSSYLCGSCYTPFGV